MSWDGFALSLTELASMAVLSGAKLRTFRREVQALLAVKPGR